MFINHLPWYTANGKDQGSTLNSSAAKLSQAAFFAPKKASPSSPGSPGSHRSGLSSLGGDSGEEDDLAADLEGFGDVSALEEGTGDDVSSRSRSPDTLPAISNGSKRGGGSPTGSKHSAGGGAGPGLANLAAMRASRAQEMDVPVSFSSFRLNYDQRLAQQKVNVVKMLKSVVSGKRKLFGAELGTIDDIFRAIDVDGSGSVDVREFRDGINRLGLGLTEAQIQEMIMVFDADGNGDIEMSEFLDLVNQPVIDVGAVARQQWLAERAKAEKAEEKLKQQAYAMARQEAEQATMQIARRTELRLSKLAKEKALRDKQKLQRAREEEREARRRLKEGVAARAQHKLMKSEVSAERLEQALHRKRDLKLHHSRSLEEVAVDKIRRRQSVSTRIAEGKEEHQSTMVACGNNRALVLNDRREAKEGVRRSFLRVQAEETERRRHMQQKAWERGTEVVRRQTMRRALQTMEKSFIEKSNRSLQDSIARSRPSSVA